MIDARNFNGNPIFKYKASNKAISSISMSYEVPGLLAASCLDGKIRIYDTA